MVFAHFALHHQSFRVDDCISFEVFLYVEFDLKGAFALLFVVFVSYKFSVCVVLWLLHYVSYVVFVSLSL
jgi:hypothetical protein